MTQLARRSAVVWGALLFAALAPVSVAAQYSAPVVLLLLDVSPEFPEVVDKVWVVGTVDPTPLHGIEWTHQLTRENEPCDDAGGSIHVDASPSEVVLVACYEGQALVTLYRVDDGQVVARVAVVVGATPKVTLLPAGELKVRPRMPTLVEIQFSTPVAGFTPDDVVVSGGAVLDPPPMPEGGGVAVSSYVFPVYPDSVGEVSLYAPPHIVRSVDYFLVNMESNTLVLVPYDDNGDGTIDGDEVIAAVRDYFAGKITPDECISVVARYFSGL